MTVAQSYSTPSTASGNHSTELKILSDTILKQKPIPSAELSDSEKQAIPAGTVLKVQSYAPESDHVKVAFAEESFQGRNTWYVYYKHGVILHKGSVAFPDRIKLAVPYKSQLDNAKNPYGSCNTTSIAMCLAYLGIKGNQPHKQLEDELQDWLEARGLSRHDPYHLAQAAEAYGAKDRFTEKATFNEIKEWLIQGNPVVIHGYFTSFGHIVCLIGYNSHGFIVHDPYGEYWSHGYNTSAPGAGLSYSYDLVHRTCKADGDCWVHFISR